MASTGKLKGRKFSVGNSEDSGTTYDYVAHLDNTTFTSSFSMDVVTDNDSAAGTVDKLPGDTEFSLSGEMYFLFDAETDKDNAMDVLALHKAKTKVDIDFTTQETGDKNITGSGYYNQFTITASTSDYVKASFEFTGTGDYAIATIA